MRIPQNIKWEYHVGLKQLDTSIYNRLFPLSKWERLKEGIRKYNINERFDNFEYGVSTLDPNAIYVTIIKTQVNDEKETVLQDCITHRVSQTKEGVKCSCPEWKFKGGRDKGKPCIHIKYLLVYKIWNIEGLFSYLF